MKILFVADVPWENVTSGAEQVLNHQATGIAKEGMRVFAITHQTGPREWSIKNTNGVCEGTYWASIEDIRSSVLSLVKYPPRFYSRFTQDGAFQVAVCHQPFNCFSLLIMGRLEHVPLLYVFHSPSHEEYSLSHEDRNWLTNLPNVETRRMIERFCIKRAAKIMVLSRYMKQKVQDIHGISADRIVVNPGGVDLDDFKPPQDRESLKDKLGFPKGKIHLLTVRNLERRMGLDNLLRCMRILKKNQKGVHLILVGEGIEKQNLENLSEKYGLVDEVTMAGFISSDFLPHYYGASDFFILPSRQLEGFGLVTPESLACGTPVLGTPVGGTNEILSGLDPSFLFRDTSPEAMVQGIQKAIAQFYPNTQGYEQLRHRCREYVAKSYSWQRHTNQLRLTLDEIIASKNKTSLERSLQKLESHE